MVVPGLLQLSHHTLRLAGRYIMIIDQNRIYMTNDNVDNIVPCGTILGMSRLLYFGKSKASLIWVAHMSRIVIAS